jgi:hypothetical protein
MTYVVSPNLSQQESTQFFMGDLKLSLMGLSDEDIHALYHDEQYPMDDGSKFLAIRKNGELVAIVKYEYFTKQAINLHFYCLRRMHHTSEPKIIVEELKKYIKNVLKINKVLLVLPEACAHVIGFAKKIGFEQEAVIKNSYVWRQQIVNLIIYGIEL